jgi:mannitol-1-phosphate 5-dehydrogenase
MKAVIIGLGKIGCGFAGERLSAAGYDLVFVGRGAMASALERSGGYRVRLTAGRGYEETAIAGVRCVASSDVERAADEIATADLVAVSVGQRGLDEVAPLLAAGLARRAAPVNVLAFENMADAGPYLLRKVEALLPAEAPRHGFSGALVSRIVARRLGDPSRGQPVTFVGDTSGEFVVHGPSLAIPLPAIPGLRLVDDYEAWVMKKLYTFSAGHATTAYLGALKGYHYLHTAIRDREIRARVLDAMEEGRRGLAARYGAEIAGDQAELEAIVRRFENAAIDDPIERVARDPQRKLGCEDRLVGAARLAEKAGVRPRLLALAAAAALCFTCPGDPGACALQRQIDEGGPNAVLRHVAGLDPERGVGRMVVESFGELAAGRPRDAVVLSFERRMWSLAAAASTPEQLELAA